VVVVVCRCGCLAQGVRPLYRQTCASRAGAHLAHCCCRDVQARLAATPEDSSVEDEGSCSGCVAQYKAVPTCLTSMAGAAQ
jgi:hypothetical protein